MNVANLSSYRKINRADLPIHYPFFNRRQIRGNRHDQSGSASVRTFRDVFGTALAEILCRKNSKKEICRDGQGQKRAKLNDCRLILGLLPLTTQDLHIVSRDKPSLLVLSVYPRRGLQNRRDRIMS